MENEAKISENSLDSEFESAVDSIVTGNLSRLEFLLEQNPNLVRERSKLEHHATLLHYIAANGVEDERQKTPGNAVEITKKLLDSGAEVDALADMYVGRHTTMSMLVSSCHPAKAGLQVELVNTLLDYGAAVDGSGSRYLMSALAFGYLPVAEALVRRGAKVEDIAAAAGLGLLEETKKLLDSADGLSRHRALALAGQLGHTAIVSFLLDAGEDPNRYNPEGNHAHSTLLHQAVIEGHLEVVKLLTERGARIDMRDKIWNGTPLDWAIYAKKEDIADYLQKIKTKL